LQTGIVKGEALDRGVGQSPTNSRKIIERQRLNHCLPWLKNIQRKNFDTINAKYDIKAD
jgi:hypothetical protein